eukprot:GHVS01027880.1.p1 GENE.GHVS01027880.1~~GHVS01027880.1.p1  ORF type:complete len:514 (-),score=90.94 GHVS01027880.1:293-1834(-)
MMAVHRWFLSVGVIYQLCLLLLPFSYHLSSYTTSTFIISAKATSLQTAEAAATNDNEKEETFSSSSEEEGSELRQTPSDSCSLANNFDHPELAKVEEMVEKDLTVFMDRMQSVGDAAMIEVGRRCRPAESGPVDPPDGTDAQIEAKECTGRVNSSGDIEMGVCSRVPDGDGQGSFDYDCNTEPVASPDICYALVLSGGGNKGSYEAGAVKGLVEKYEGKIRWDVVAGVSAGSLNAFTSRYYRPGDEKKWSERLVDLWSHEVKQSDVSSCKLPLKKNLLSFGRKFISALVLRKPTPWSLCENTPLADMSRRLFHNKKVYKERGIAISACRLNDMKYVTFTDQRSSEQQLLRAVLASTAVPGIFPPVEVDIKSGQYYYDGGIMNNANIASAVKRCMDLKGVPADKVVVDYLYTSPKAVNYFTVRPGKVTIWDLVGRAFHMLRRESGKESCIIKARGRYPGFRVRHYIAPVKIVMEKLLHHLELLDLTNRDVISRIIEEGIKDGRQAQCYRESTGI